MTIDELRTWLFLSKFTHKVPGVFDGWQLVDESYDKSLHSLYLSYLSSFNISLEL